MTFLAPGFLWGAVLVAAGIVALHFIVTRQPRASILPTARFVPDSAATATVRDARPSDLLLMLLRVLVVLAAGAALAKPVIKPSRRADARLFLMDASRSVANVGEAADSVKKLYRAGDAVIVFDSAARSLGARGFDSLAAIRGSDAQGNLSAGLIASLREGNMARDRADSLELVIVSPFADEEHDAATDSIRRLWPGRARVVRVTAREDSAVVGGGAIEIRSGSDDPLAVAVSLASKQQPRANTRIVRNATIIADDAGWGSSSGHVLVIWPTDGRPLFAVPHVPVDQSGGIMSGEVRVIAAFDRRWMFPADSLRAGRVVARWADGRPAAVEKRVGQGCIRSVAIPVAAVGDLVIRPEFIALVREIAAPCGDPRSTQPLASTVIASLGGHARLAPGDAFTARDDIASPLAPWLFGIALAAALSELLVRRISPSRARRSSNVTTATSGATS
jgi:hypothetical protein